MIDHIDDVLRKLLIREMPIKKSEIDVAFDQPKREWAAQLSRPTLNIFLLDVHENTKLRQKQWGVESRDNGRVVQRMTPVRVDLHYLITAWATEPEDEHRILTRALLALLRFPFLPEDLLPEEMSGQPVEMPIEVAQTTGLQNAADVWSVLDNEIRPNIKCMVTAAVDPYQPFEGPMVRTRELRVGPGELRPAAGEEGMELQLQPPLEPVDGDRFWTVGGQLHGDVAPGTARLTLVERGVDVPIRPEGRFTIGNLQAGDYTLELWVEGEKKPSRFEVTVPSETYDIGKS